MGERLPEPGEYFVERGLAWPGWFTVDMLRTPWPVQPEDWRAGPPFNAIITLYRDGTATVRRSLGAAEHR